MKTTINKLTGTFTCLLIFLLATTPLTPKGKQKTAKGIVFEDTNQNGILDKNEKGLPNIPVSNQYDVVKTDRNGRFQLPIEKETIIFVTKPAGYTVPMDPNNISRFYYIHQPKGSPPGLKYKGIQPTGKLPGMLHFPLVKTPMDDSFDVIVMGDPQTQTLQELSYYRDDVVSRIVGTDARFYIALGDILYDDLSFYDRMDQVVGKIGIPVYHVMGNHDMNFQVPDHIHEAETFKRTYGPDYYSFDYGKVHFVVLNTVKYMGWDHEKNRRGRYVGYVHERQLTWLKNDLAFVPNDHLVVLTMHIPIMTDLMPYDNTRILNREALFNVLENRNHLLALAGHMHLVEYIEFNEKTGWQSNTEFPSLTSGAGCGTWWHGPKDVRGIPYGICTDGAPSGYFRFSFYGSGYKWKFHPTGPVTHSQMRINSPGGTLSMADLKDGQINVNVFAGTPRTIVKVQLDDQPEVTMERKLMKDPFVEKLMKSKPELYTEWMVPALSPHIWVAPLPATLVPGVHRLKVTVTDQHGAIFTEHGLFEIDPNLKPETTQ
ncbi:MAG: Cna protein B-type domain containing protein [bacterium]|nr:Cna protein B-type domain containing protein [bacterium]